MRNKIPKNICWAMVLILFITWSGIPQNVAYAQKTARLKDEERKRTVEKLEKLFDALEEAAKEIPRDTFDPQAIVNKVGKDPIKLFEWVRDNTYLVPYRGSLRGPVGVLMDRLGNSLDRSLLLHELMTIAGKKVRLARGTLSKEQAEIALKEARPIPPGGALPAEVQLGENINELITKHGEKYGLDQVELQRVAQKLTLEQQHMAEKIAQWVKEQTKAILKLVGEPKTDFRAAERAKAIEELQDQWWVQVEKNSAWLDLDLTNPDKRPGEAVATLAHTYFPSAIDEGLFHTITLRVIVEQWDHVKLTEREVLQHSMQPGMLIGEHMRLRHVPLNLPRDLHEAFVQGRAQRLSDAILETRQWVPVLVVGSKQIVQAGFTTGGELLASPMQTKPAGGLLGDHRPFPNVFGALGAEAEKRVEDDLQLTAEWLEYEIKAPGRAPQKVRRSIFDLLGPTAREAVAKLPTQISERDRLSRGFSLFGETDILFQVSRIPPEFVADLATKRLLDIEDKFWEATRGVGTRQDFLKTVTAQTPLPGPHYQLAVIRHQGGQELSAVYLDRPNVITFTRNLREGGDGRLIQTAKIDIVQNRSKVRFPFWGRRFQIMVEQGVRDTCAEALIAAALGPVTANTAQLSMESLARGTTWTTLQSVRDLNNIEGNLTSEFEARLRAELERGYIILAPSKPLRVDGEEQKSWWRINRMNGHTLGYTDEGGLGGGALIEAVLTGIEIGLVAYCGYESIVYADRASSGAMGTGERILRPFFVFACVGFGFFGVLMHMAKVIPLLVLCLIGEIISAIGGKLLPHG